MDTEQIPEIEEESSIIDEMRNARKRMIERLENDQDTKTIEEFLQFCRSQRNQQS